MKHYHCKECGSELWQDVQETGPYSRDASGQIVAGGRQVILHCTNVTCTLWYCTTTPETYEETTTTFLKAARHA